jgi:hypothetical protein
MATILGVESEPKRSSFSSKATQELRSGLARIKLADESTHAAVCRPTDARHFPGFDVNLEAPMANPGTGIVSQDRIMTWRQRDTEPAFRIGRQGSDFCI